MKNLTLKFALLFIMLTCFTSCELIGDIFQAGMAIGIIIVILIIALIFWIIRKLKR